MTTAPSTAGDVGVGDAGERADAAVPYTGVHRVVRRLLEPAQDILVVGLAVALLATMVRSLILLVEHATATTVPPRLVLGETLFVLVLVELLRLLVIYLRDHHVSVDVMVEATLVGSLREVLVRGVTELPTGQLLALAAFVLALGLLLRFGDLRASQRCSLARPRGQPADARDDERATVIDDELVRGRRG